MTPIRWLLVAIGIVVFVLPLTLSFIGSIPGVGPAAFPPPVENQAVYDVAEVLTPSDEAALEDRIDALEGRSGAEMAIYLQVDPSQTFDSNLALAEQLLNEWGVGRRGFDDGFVILVSFGTSLEHGVISTYGGGGFTVAYLDIDEQQALINGVIGPRFHEGDFNGGLLAAMDVVDAAVTPEATATLNAYRVANAVIGIPGGILAFVLTAGIAFIMWRREGDDPEVLDSESVLMAGPPAGMTPPLATVVREGRASKDALQTILIELAGTGFIRFRNLDRVGKVKSDDDPNPETDPAIDLLKPPRDQADPRGPTGEAYQVLLNRGGGPKGSLTREALWGVNAALNPIKGSLEAEAVRMGWFTRLPTPAITKWTVIGVLEAAAGGGLLFLGFTIPMSGLTLVGGALIAGGLITLAFGTQMSKRTDTGAYADAMLKAYRRTLQKTMQQAQSMAAVVAEPTVRILADTPDKAVIWGVALGLRDEVSQVLTREMADPTTQATLASSGAYYPVWFGSSGSMGGDGGGGSLFSGSGIPDVGGMMGALGSVGSSPPSSSSGGGGGFGGGGGGGGGGASGGF